MDFACDYFVAEKEHSYDLFSTDKLQAKNDKSDNDGSDSELSDEEEEEQVQKVENAKLRKVRKANTNVLAVKFGTLVETASLFTGDAVLCKNCSAALTEISKLSPNPDSSNQIWKCEYCNNVNDVNLDFEEIPKGDTIDYLLKPPAVQSVDQQGAERTDIVIFCIDISGSMCCTEELSGEFKIKKNENLERSLSSFVEQHNHNMADQFLPNEKRDITYVSRLQCVQAAVTSQIEELAKTSPGKRVAIVTFSNEVTIHLPGGIKHVIAGDKLNDLNYLAEVVTNLGLKIDSPIKDTHQELTQTVINLEESGSTALGPALAVSVSVAALAPGSAVVLCTDGIANVGVGSLEDLTSDNVEMHPAPAFYNQMAQHATQKGVSVSIMSIKGANSSLEWLGKISVATNGINHIVDPKHMTKNFNFVLSNSIIATEVTAALFLHCALTFKHEQEVNGTSCLRRVGNVTKETNTTFEYKLQDPDKLNDLKQIPFQIQIRYTKLDGSQCLRVISKVEQVTKNREEAEANLNVKVVGLHAQQHSAKLASEGNYSKARMVQKSTMRMVKKNLKSDEQLKHYNLWTQEAKRLNKAIKRTKIKEEREGIDYHSAAEDESEDEEDEERCNSFDLMVTDDDEGEKKKKRDRKQEKKEISEKRKKGRTFGRTTDDDLSNVLYQAQNPIYSAFEAAENPLYSNK